MKRFNFKYIDFSKRFSIELLWIEWLVVISIIIYILNNEVNALIFGLLLQFSWLHRVNRRHKYYLTVIQFQNEIVIIEGYKYNKQFSIEVDKQDIVLKITPIFSKGFFPFMLVFEDTSGEKYFHQYAIGNIKAQNLKELLISYKEWKNENLSLDEKDTINRLK